MPTHSSVLAGESQGQGSLVGCGLWGHTESDTTEETYPQQRQQYLWKCFVCKFDYLEVKLIITLPNCSSFSCSCRFLSWLLLNTVLLCHLILSSVLCLWSLFCRLQIPVPLALVSAPWWVRWSRDLCPYPLDREWIVITVSRACLNIEGTFVFPLWLSLPCQGWGLLPD